MITHAVFTVVKGDPLSRNPLSVFNTAQSPDAVPKRWHQPPQMLIRSTQPLLAAGKLFRAPCTGLAMASVATRTHAQQAASVGGRQSVQAHAQPSPVLFPCSTKSVLSGVCVPAVCLGMSCIVLISLCVLLQSVLSTATANSMYAHALRTDCRA